jgi:hypothetical protein
MPRRKAPPIPDALLDKLLAGADPKTAFDPNGLIDGLKKAPAERVRNAEMDHHLAGEEPGNRRNGYGKKTVIADTGQIERAVPRDRQARFDPQRVAKYQRRFPGFDDKVISMYARGMSTREIPGSSPGTGHLRDLCGIEVSPDPGLRRAVTDAVPEEVAAWQARPLAATYPLVFFDALRVKIRDAKGHGAWSATRPSPSRSACAPTAPRKSWAFGSSRTRAPGLPRRKPGFCPRVQPGGEEPRRRRCAGRRRRRPQKPAPAQAGAGSASSICCATAAMSSPGRTASPWRPR